MSNSETVAQANTVLIDMDGVMADFDSAALVDVPHELRVPRTQFYVAHDYPIELRPQIESVYNAPAFFEELEPMPGLHEAWQTLLDNGYQPRVASAPLSSNRSAVEGKIKWLDRVMVPTFGASVVEHAIIDKNKWRYHGLALIDDRPHVPRGIDEANDATWQHILFGWPHLATVPETTTDYRLLDWHHTTDMLRMLGEIAEAGSR